MIVMLMKNKHLADHGLTLIAALLFVTAVAQGQGTWERVNTPTRQYLRSAFFVDSLTGWVAGDSGVIMRTLDGGSSWKLLDIGMKNDFSAIFFFDRNTGYATVVNYVIEPYGTFFLKTTDGGDTWSVKPYPKENVFITCLYFFNEMNGWMGGRPHTIVRTADGGETWNQAAVDTSILAFFPVLTLRFYNEKYGYASGGLFDIAGVIWRTSNGGEKWYAIDPSDAPADEVRGLHCYDSLHVIGAGGDPDYGYGVGMIRTSNGGLDWDYDEIGMQGLAFDIDFRTPYEAWAPLGPQRLLIYSLDSGNTWNSYNCPDTAEIFSITFPDSLHGYAVGTNGTVLRYRPKINPGIHETPGISDFGIRLGQNRPNPSGGITTIGFSVDPGSEWLRPSFRQHGSRLRILITDLAGRAVFSEVIGSVLSGENIVNINTSSLKPGIYLYRIVAFAGLSQRAVTRTLKLTVQ